MPAKTYFKTALILLGIVLQAALVLAEVSMHYGMPSESLNDDEKFYFMHVMPENLKGPPAVSSGPYGAQLACLGSLNSSDYFGVKDVLPGTKGGIVGTGKMFVLSGNDKKTGDPGFFIFTAQGSHFLTFRNAELAGCVQKVGQGDGNSFNQINLKIDNTFLSIPTKTTSPQSTELNGDAQVYSTLNALSLPDPVCLQKRNPCVGRVNGTGSNEKCIECPPVPPKQMCTHDSNRKNDGAEADAKARLNETIASLIATQNAQYVKDMKGTRDEPGLLIRANMLYNSPRESKNDDSDKKEKVPEPKPKFDWHGNRIFEDTGPWFIKGIERPNLMNVQNTLDACAKIAENDPSAKNIATAVEAQKKKFGLPFNFETKEKSWLQEHNPFSVDHGAK